MMQTPPSCSAFPLTAGFCCLTRGEENHCVSTLKFLPSNQLISTFDDHAKLVPRLQPLLPEQQGRCWLCFCRSPATSSVPARRDATPLAKAAAAEGIALHLRRRPHGNGAKSHQKDQEGLYYTGVLRVRHLAVSFWMAL